MQIPTPETRPHSLDAAAGGVPIRERRRKRRGKSLVVGAVVAVGALAGTGFAVQSAFAAQERSVAMSASLNAVADVKSEQRSVYPQIAMARASYDADAAVERADASLAAAKGKVGAKALRDALLPLQQRAILGPQGIYRAIDRIDGEIADLDAAVAAFDRAAAEKAAAERAAAEQAAAEKAAAEQAAAEQAAAERAAEEAAQAEQAPPAAPSYPAAPANPSDAQQIARGMLAEFGWGDDQFGCLVELWNHESGWNVNAYNASSGAGGIPQALPASKMASAGADWATNPATQIRWGLGYIQGRYGSPCGAWDSFSANGWY